jgi:hypothetical protein
MGRTRRSLIICGTAALLAQTACKPGIPKDALALSPQSLADRQLETRRFATIDEKMLLAASAAVLQDLGFTIENSETAVGLVVASKDRDASEAGQVVAAVAVAVLLGVYMPTDRNQKIRASLVTAPVGDGMSTRVRITFQRVVWNTQGQVSKSEALREPTLYQTFFDKLSQSVFLQANGI